MEEKLKEIGQRIRNTIDIMEKGNLTNRQFKEAKDLIHETKSVYYDVKSHIERNSKELSILRWIR